MTVDKNKKSVRIGLRVTPSEFKVIKKNSEKACLNISEYIRRTVMGEKIVSAPPADFILLIREIKRVGNDLNQVNQKLNTQGTVHTLELERCSNEISETVKMLYRTFRPGKGDG